MIRALFVGGVVDNSEMDLEGPQPPKNYPENTGGGASRYSLRQLGVDGERVADERDYARRFEATPQTVH